LNDSLLMCKRRRTLDAACCGSIWIRKRNGNAVMFLLIIDCEDDLNLMVSK